MMPDSASSTSTTMSARSMDSSVRLTLKNSTVLSTLRDLRRPAVSMSTYF